jgi:NAD+ synthase
MKNETELIDRIVAWIKQYSDDNKISSLVVGVSGGIDSALVSTLCAKTSLPTYTVSMPIRQKDDQLSRAYSHIDWLKANYDNVIPVETNLTRLFEVFEMSMSHTQVIEGFCGERFDSELGFANSRSRLRMTALYQIATSRNGIVVGTGNKVEDFGVGFFTKYGDGGVDISPIADLMKSEVKQLAISLGVIQSIIDAPPTDGLWETDRTDEVQIGATYDELERAMSGVIETDRDQQVMNLYRNFHSKNLHKMNPIPVFRK